MSYIIFDKDSGKILAEVIQGQILEKMMSNWPNCDYLEVQSNTSVLTKLSARFYSVNPQTRELIKLP